MDQNHGDCALGKQPDFEGTLFWRRHIGLGQKVCEMTFEHRLVTARDQASGVSTEIGKLDDKARKSGTGPSRLVRPDRQIFEQLVNDGLRRTGEDRKSTRLNSSHT